MLNFSFYLKDLFYFFRACRDGPSSERWSPQKRRAFGGSRSARSIGQPGAQPEPGRPVDDVIGDLLRGSAPAPERRVGAGGRAGTRGHGQRRHGQRPHAERTPGQWAHAERAHAERPHAQRTHAQRTLGQWALGERRRLGPSRQCRPAPGSSDFRSRRRGRHCCGRTVAPWVSISESIPRNALGARR